MKKEKIFERKWLNENEGSAYSMLECEIDKRYQPREEDPETYMVQASLEIKDCNRQVELDFAAWNREELEERIAKAEGMIETLEKLKDFLVSCRSISMKEKDEPEDE